MTLFLVTTILTIMGFIGGGMIGVTCHKRGVRDERFWIITFVTGLIWAIIAVTIERYAKKL